MLQQIFIMGKYIYGILCVQLQLLSWIANSFFPKVSYQRILPLSILIELWNTPVWYRGKKKTMKENMLVFKLCDFFLITHVLE